MYWQEDSKPEPQPVVADDVADVAYAITCRCLPVDHAYALSQAVSGALPWFAGEPAAGLHTIHVADSGNGWMRPQLATDLLYLSRRTRLVLRLPRPRVPDAAALVGRTLDVAGQSLLVGAATVRPLAAVDTLFARYVVVGAAVDEQEFVAAAVAALRALEVQPKKVLCGIEHDLATPSGPLRTRSLMLADLTRAESLRVQRHGLGPHRHLGCGLFIPHKGIREVGQVLD